MNQGLITQKCAHEPDLSYPVDLSGDPLAWQRNEQFLPRWRFLSGGYTSTPQSSLQSGDPIEQALRPFTGPLYTTTEQVDTRRFEDMRTRRVRMGQQPGPAQQQLLNEYMARNAAIEHWGPQCGLARYHQDVIDNWDSKPDTMPTQFK